VADGPSFLTGLSMQAADAGLPSLARDATGMQLEPRTPLRGEKQIARAGFNDSAKAARRSLPPAPTGAAFHCRARLEVATGSADRDGDSRQSPPPWIDSAAELDVMCEVSRWKSEDRQSAPSGLIRCPRRLAAH
jgi:hypothetical protein